MSITGAGSITAANIQAENNMNNQLNTLATSSAPGRRRRPIQVWRRRRAWRWRLNAQTGGHHGYSNTATTVGTTLSVAQSALTQIGSVGSAVEQAIERSKAVRSLSTITARRRRNNPPLAQLDQILSLLNTQAGDNYLFSGSAVNQPSVATTDAILNGNGAQAGLTQVIAERQQADLGTDGLGRLVIPAASGSTVSVSEDVAGSPFGFKLAGVNSSLTGAAVSGPSRVAGSDLDRCLAPPIRMPAIIFSSA